MVLGRAGYVFIFPIRRDADLSVWNMMSVFLVQQNLTFLSAVILSACLPKDTIIDGPLVHKERSEQEESQEQTESQDNSKPSGEEQESSTVSKQSTKDQQEDSDNKH